MGRRRKKGYPKNYISRTAYKNKKGYKKEPTSDYSNKYNRSVHKCVICRKLLDEVDTLSNANTHIECLVSKVTPPEKIKPDVGCKYCKPRKALHSFYRIKGEIKRHIKKLKKNKNICEICEIHYLYEPNHGTFPCQANKINKKSTSAYNIKNLKNHQIYRPRKGSLRFMR